ncbi:phosphoglycerate kinase [Candidatus Beckwithbacteria bacterium CG10_big_fil_rev_8_21_14_0_10_34_10]|uniref:Phosphoglycerate kinase n=1 Tax=Candidatus Beckwithbacteria bacterium CG10_big_fil_rev_8_21_14_0_10_34_10 TaxID=1974495 RepID=A0A2H0W8Z1_9BACT|nr:MAG: phosphoglycerate kinase [Candidatus Beckwithbacteria bacterium CG10_big_fil_rev_8_21_14_0_10_34_10]
MNKKTLRDVDVNGKRVIHHCDFNIKLRKNEKGELVPISDVRIKAYFPSIFYLLNHGAKIIFISYLERPGGKVVKKLSLAPVAKRLSQLINRQVHFIDQLVGPKATKFVNKIRPGEMVMLENTRFYPGEEEDSNKLAKKISQLGDLKVMDAFGHAHRIHASVTGIPRHLPSVAGFYLESEIKTFDKLMKNPKRPLVLIVGGTKIFDKIAAVRNLIKKADYILVGGAVANNFLKAQRIEVGQSFMAEPYVDKAKGEKLDPVELSAKLIKDFPHKVIIPIDVKVGDNINNPKNEKIIDLKKGKLPKNWTILDIGPKTIKKYLAIIKIGKTIFWDGPMGKYEDPRFRAGTLEIAQAIANSNETTILAGGDTAAIAEDTGLIFRYSHVSIAGGAALQYLAGKKLPGVEILAEK